MGGVGVSIIRREGKMFVVLLIDTNNDRNLQWNLLVRRFRKRTKVTYLNNSFTLIHGRCSSLSWSARTLRSSHAYLRWDWMRIEDEWLTSPRSFLHIFFPQGNRLGSMVVGSAIGLLISRAETMNNFDKETTWIEMNNKRTFALSSSLRRISALIVESIVARAHKSIVCIETDSISMTIISRGRGTLVETEDKYHSHSFFSGYLIPSRSSVGLQVL